MNEQALTPDIKVELIDIGYQMNQSGLPKEFVAAAVSTAFEFEGVYDLMKLWAEEEEETERDEIIADIQDMIDDCFQREKIEKAYIRFDDLDAISKNIRVFKDSLRGVVDENGGIKTLAALTGIPQPSLSRFFNSNTMPRRATLLKIAKALKLSQVQIATEWLR